MEFCTKSDLKKYTKMINRILRKSFSFILLFFFSLHGFSQENETQTDTLRTQVFSLSPMSKYTENVNGLVVGFGHLDNKFATTQTINGANIEANPAPAVGVLMAFMSLMYIDRVIKNNIPSRIERMERRKDKEKYFHEVKDMETLSELQLNGINLSTGCFFKRTSMNGLNISVGNHFKNFNGLSISALGTIANTQNGASVGILNMNNSQNGFSIGIVNHSVALKGVQFGVYNRVKTAKGLQVGIVNRSFSKSFQVGIWNKNKKRSFPLINW